MSFHHITKVTQIHSTVLLFRNSDIYTKKIYSGMKPLTDNFQTRSLRYFRHQSYSHRSTRIKTYKYTHNLHRYLLHDHVLCAFIKYTLLITDPNLISNLSHAHILVILRHLCLKNAIKISRSADAFGPQPHISSI